MNRDIISEPAVGKPNYADLVQRVETEVFADPAIPKGEINLNAEFGRIVVRGEVTDEKIISYIVQRIWSVPGVDDVVSYLHPAGTPAPAEEPRPGPLGTLPT